MPCYTPLLVHMSLCRIMLSHFSIWLCLAHLFYLYISCCVQTLLIVLQLFVGFEYECTRGHRFMIGSDVTPLRKRIMTCKVSLMIWNFKFYWKVFLSHSNAVLNRENTLRVKIGSEQSNRFYKDVECFQNLVILKHELTQLLPCSLPKLIWFFVLQDTGLALLNTDLPLWMQCTCRRPPRICAQLMRLHIVTPKAPVTITLNPRVKVNCG